MILNGIDVERFAFSGPSPGGPIVAVALVLCAVFVPCAFIGGITGQFFRQFAVTISVSTVISAINAVTMTPSRAVMIFKTDESQPHGHQREAVPWWTFAVLGSVLTGWLAPQYLEKLELGPQTEQIRLMLGGLHWTGASTTSSTG